ncbi:28bc44f0-32c8-4d65-92d8-c941ee4ad80e [Sclerotinia trifoliorum]|uniref:28bc44f0-32c8-4d65-92d8-c941ee4ad80e n=1 Tax=Sclerotinia trifoliorum TaxID=28548 RepID=A0A8H2VZS2_9HELO|nr:28bc44f0-32c8-4d65-92d8-c941ee4ad80e [Sclerotinia trifoliorum]
MSNASERNIHQPLQLKNFHRSMLSSNSPASYRGFHQQVAVEEDLRHHNHRQNSPQMHTQNSPQPNSEQQQFEQNAQHVQMRPSQRPLLSPTLKYSYGNQFPSHTENDNRSSTPQPSGFLQNGSASRPQRSASGPSNMSYSLQTFYGQHGEELSPHEVDGNVSQVVIRSPTARRRGRPPKNLSGISSHKPEKPAIPRKRGRPPKDYTAPVSIADSEPLTAKCQKPANSKKPNSQSDDNPPKRRGRPPKRPSPEVEIPLPNPPFQIYGCEWDKCPAKLHNLDTLRMHLSKVHGKREDDMFNCLWKGCTKVQTPNDGSMLSSESTNTTKYRFENENDWKRHVEKKHVIRFAWHMGDGPRNSLDGPQKHNASALPAYLFDKNGVQVTPSVKDQQIEYGDPKETSAQRFKRTISGLDFVLNPIYNSNYATPIQSVAKDGGENDEVHSSNEGKDDGNDTNMEDIEDIDADF